MQTNQFLYWEMENGHQHSFLIYNTEDVLKEFATENNAGELNQKEYQIYVAAHENTNVIDEVVEEFTELIEELAQKWLDNDYIADFEVEETV